MVFTDWPIVFKIRVFMFGVGMLAILLTTVSTLLLKLKEKREIGEETEDTEIDNYEINEMLSYKFKTRVIVPIVSLNEECISALRLAKTMSDDITIFGAYDNYSIREKMKEELKPLENDINIVIKHLVNVSATEQLLDFIESVEYNYAYGDNITIILPKSASVKKVSSFLEDKTKLYIKHELLRYSNIVVMTMS